MNSSMTLQPGKELTGLSLWQIIKINGFFQLQSSAFPHIHSQSCKVLGSTHWEFMAVGMFRMSRSDLVG